MRLLVVSDLHIRGPEDPLYLSLLGLLRKKTQPGDILVLAGDLFDFLVGNKRLYREKYQDFFQSMADATRRGTQIHYIEGNHDFLLREAFREIQGLTIHSDEVTLELGGKRFFVAHGDTVDRSDYSYRLLRGFFRSPLIKAFVMLAPGGLVDQIGKKSSRYSRDAKPSLPTELPIERMESLRKTYRNFAAERLSQGYDFVVLGHCHDLDEMKFKIGNRSGQYVNVGFPRVHGSYLAWTPGEDVITREPLP